MNERLAATVLALSVCLCSPAASAFAQQSALQPGFQPAKKGVEEWIVLVVIDDETGYPIADAEVLLIDERSYQPDQATWDTRNARSDRDGIARLRVDDLPLRRSAYWCVVRAANYGARSCHGLPREAVWCLSKSVRWQVRILDFKGRPSEGVRLSVALGCGHTPNIETRISDKAGLVTFSQVDALARHVEIFTHDRRHTISGPGRPEFFPGDPPWVALFGTSHVLGGQLMVDCSSGSVRVGVGGTHRGPWAVVDKTGSFELVGARPGAQLSAVVKPGQVVPIRSHGEAKGVTTWQVGRQDDSRPSLTTIEAKLRISGLRNGSEPITKAHCSIGSWLSRDGYVRIPKRGHVTLESQIDGANLISRLSAEKLAKDALVDIEWPRPNVVQVQIVDASGDPCAVSAAITRWRADLNVGHWVTREAHFKNGLVRLDTPVTGAAALWMRRMLPDGVEVKRVVQLSLPSLGHQDVTKLGSFELERHNGISVKSVSGAALFGRVRVGLVRSGFSPAGQPLECHLSDSGWCDGIELASGDVVVLRGLPCEQRMWVRSRHQWAGQRPFVVQGHAGRARLKIVDGSPSQASYKLTVKGTCADVEDGWVVENIPLGECTFRLSAEDGRSAVVKKQLVQGSETTVTMRL